MAKSAHVKLNVRPNGTFLTLYPAAEGGRNLIIDEVEAYLDKVIQGGYEKVIVREELKKPLLAVREVQITSEKIPPVNETVIVSIMADRLSVRGRFYPPTEGGSLLDRDGIIAEMVKSGVKYGVAETAITEFLNNRQYEETIIIAEATRQVEGSDAKITFYFNTDLTQKPKVNEDGSVDFHHLDVISSVSAGDLLAELTPAVQGKPGIDVCGGLLRPVKVRPKILRVGKNIRLSEDGLKAYSEVNGHATVEGEQVFVSNMYEVPANVDTSTGDIEYEGNVLVHGNVLAGFSITAKGDIVVEGVVEGASLRAGGHIILKRGIQGMDRGILKANGNVISRFIESATVEAGGYVSADAIMHSSVSAKGDITVDGKKGFITGGNIRSGTMVSAKTIGSSMGTSTNIEVGIEPEIISEYHDLGKEQETLKEEQEKNMQILLALAKRIKLGEKLAPDKLLQFKKANEAKDTMSKREEEIAERMKVLKETIDSYEGGMVKVSSVAHPGVKLTISNAVYYVKTETSYCRFIKSQGDVKIDSYL